ncbi:ABC transporter substrate-binding protein [Paludibacterium sp. THUN1379]|uniref:substrate-binding periplasmic protein n=1 Tax=Paludibacterium sp. THUN1379 TaxID=3112107 RepID=UPI00308BB0D0|nr:ABC transporter substrate-binding protein [Paludibacterium sp. THUN1379]
MNRPGLPRCLLLSALSLLALAWRPAAAIPSQVTADLPPFSIQDAQHPRGLIYDIVQAAHRRLNWPFHPQFLPWVRAQKLASMTPDTLIFGLSRTPRREQQYQWIAVIYTAQNHFVTLDGPPIGTLAEARQRMFIGVEQGSAMADYLQQQQFTNVVALPNEQNGVTMLMQHHISAWFTFAIRANYYLRAEHYRGKVSISPPFQTVKLWLAANPDYPAQKANALRRELARMKADGSYDRIVARYTDGR